MSSYFFTIGFIIIIGSAIGAFLVEDQTMIPWGKLLTILFLGIGAGVLFSGIAHDQIMKRKLQV